MTAVARREEGNDGTVANLVAAELLRIGQRDPDGLILPETVLEEAQRLDSPLHRFFEWDDSEAAHQYRLAQARQLIVRTTLSRQEPGVRFVNVVVSRPTGARRRGYMDVDRARDDPELFEQVVADSLRMISAARNRLSAFTRTTYRAVEHLDDARRELSTMHQDGEGVPRQLRGSAQPEHD